jgi:hypothetical protein
MKPSYQSCFVFIIILFTGCHNITIPKGPDQDKQPIITITVTNFTTAYTGTFSNDATMNITNGTKIQYAVIARNTVGGVKELHFDMPDIGLSNTSMGAPDASGYVPEQLSLVGNGTTPFIDTYTGQGRAYTATATAVNFNGQPTTVVFTVQIAFNRPVISHFAFDKDPVTGDDGTYIKVGQSIHANYSITDCNGCSVLIRGTEGTYLTPQDFPSISSDHLPTPSGSFLVHPTHTYSTYTLTCFSNWGTAAPAVLHQQWNAVPKVPPSGNTYYYLVHDASACWTQSVISDTPEHGEDAIRTGTTDNLTFTVISYTDFINPDACPL